MIVRYSVLTVNVICQGGKLVYLVNGEFEIQELFKFHVDYLCFLRFSLSFISCSRWQQATEGPVN